MNKRIAAAAASASLLAGAAGFAIGVTGTAGAQSGSPTTTTAPGAKPKSDAWIQDALKPLLDNGTLNQSQIDAVTKALQDARPAGKGPMDGGMRRGGPGGGGPGGGGAAGNLSGAATALGVTPEEVRTALQSGQSLADLAKSKGVDPQKVIDALLAPIIEHEKADVTSGKDTQAEADKEIADATARITDFVNGKAPAKGAGVPKGGARPGGHGKGAPTAPTTTAPAGS